MMQKFPKEEQGSIEIIDNRVRYNEGRGNDAEEFDLNKLKYVNVTLLGDTPYLLFFSDYQHYISSTSKGFENVYKQLSSKFGFNDEAFFEVMNQTEEITKRVWVKPQKTNYHFLDQFYDDYKDGWEVQTNPPKFISWDTTINELETYKIGSFFLDEFDNEYFKIDNPVRFGNMILDDLTILTQAKRKDIGLQEFVIDLYHESLSDKSYHEIKENWSKIIPIDVEENGYEREDQNYLYFYLSEEEDIYFSIVYSYNVESNNDDGATSFHIVNNRDYSHVMYDEALEKSIEISESINLKEDYDIEESYSDNLYVVDTPERVKELMGEKSLIWIDKKAHRIGFSNTECSLVYPLTEIVSFSIYNVLPARGPGYAELRVNLKNEVYNRVFTAATYDFDALAPTLEQWTKKIVEIPEEYYND